mmetsp:Transcript_32029/g.101992  ORF Transcript_32029/g.101992 Transcript_32029/m.101992 type:complete len:198 (-) Transcript_32029:875-1468(-)|eukprot:CAMPEP_0182900320 /NCGR_PEP_ID=MMETSP0034_2-20130328/28750_1 /TAXON_ID=156128 /ORGANISM="Nephroselmis pyriformis, Strain CCMP717" /LENGTH=197 /DNA_ID=CAMNT_0025034517 /DNA_START=40 /DNA_END=633 /DNA_ORIENTATION=-
MNTRYVALAVLVALVAPAMADPYKSYATFTGPITGSVEFYASKDGETDIDTALTGLPGNGGNTWAIHQNADCTGDVVSVTVDGVLHVDGALSGTAGVQDGTKKYYKVAGVPIAGYYSVNGHGLKVTSSNGASSCAVITEVPYVRTWNMEPSAKAGFLVGFTVVVFCFGCLVMGILKVNKELNIVKKKIGLYEEDVDV